MTQSPTPTTPLPLEHAHRTPAGSTLHYWLALAALFVLVMGSYWPSMRGEFLWDDDYYVTNNKSLSRPDGIENIWLGVRDWRTYSSKVVPQYYPMTITSFWVQTRGHDWQEPLHSWPFHLINVLLHFGSAWMLWTILRRLNMPGAFVASAIWALHPVQVESVAWITERKNVLSTFFMFASMIVYLKFARLDLLNREAATAAPPLSLDGLADQEPNRSSQGSFALPGEPVKLYAIALVLFICSILSKSVTGIMPAAMLLIIWWKRDQIDWKRDVLPLLPFFACAIAMGLTTSFFERNVVGAQGPEWSIITPIQRCLIAGGAVWFYAFKLICPYKLAFFYPRWNLHSPWLAVALGALVAFVVWLWVARPRIGRGPIVVALLFIGGLFPALGFVNYLPMRYSFVADHFQYIASAALIAGGVWWLHRFFTSPIRFTIASGLIIGAITAMTFAQNHVYISPWNLWTDTVKKNPTSWAAWNNLGVLERNKGDFTDAERDLKRSLQIRPENADAVMNLGVLEQMRGNLDGAIDKLKQAAEIAADDPIHGAANSRIYYHLGVVYKQKADLNASFTAFRIAVDLDHRNLDAINSCGAVLREEGKPEYAKAWFDRAIAIDPLFLPAHANLGNIYWTQGDIQKALEEYRFVLHNDRNNVIALDGMGRVSAALGQWEIALRYFKKALEIDPEFSEAQQNLIATVRQMQKAATQPATTRSTTAPTTLKSSKRQDRDHLPPSGIPPRIQTNRHE